MKNYIVTCLTYKRKNPKIFEMLRRDPELTIYFGVRKEEYDSGFYDEWKNNPQIQFLLLENCIDAGDTRQKILDACYELGYTYVAQLDDTVRNLRNTKKQLSPTRCIEQAINEIETHELKPIGFEFVRRRTVYKQTRKVYLQAWIINVKRLMLTDVRFRCVKDVGWDDFVFSWELHNQGYYTITDPQLIRVAKSSYPWANEPGGTHVGESFEIEKMINKNNERCKKAKKWIEDHYLADNVSTRKLTSKGKTFDYLHAEWREA